jgi:hypothetical protein
MGGRTCRLLAERVFGDAGEVILRSEKARTRGEGLLTKGRKIKWRSGIGKIIGGNSSVAIPEV